MKQDAQHPRSASEPIRTCVGCHERDAQRVLVRVTVAREGVEADLRRRAPGRGAYVHTRPECLDRAIRSGFARSFRRPIRPQEAEGLRAFGTEAPSLDSVLSPIESNP